MEQAFCTACGLRLTLLTTEGREWVVDLTGTERKSQGGAAEEVGW